MLIEAITLVTLAQANVSPATGARTVHEKVCGMRGSPGTKGMPGLVALPEQKRVNATGVLLLVNCTNRKVVDVRDPNSSHLNRFVYARGVTRRMPDDPRPYEVLNFNTRLHNTGSDYTVYVKPQDWIGPCNYKGLQLTTIDPANPADRQTTTFDLNICTNLILAMVKPVAMSAGSAVKPSLPQ